MTYDFLLWMLIVSNAAPAVALGFFTFLYWRGKRSGASQ
jgi:hypothetical protein